MEFAITASIAILVLMNVYDISRYISQGMTVQSVAQVVVQAIWRTCDTAHVPATTFGSAFNSIATTAIQSTAFGNQITLKSSFVRGMSLGSAWLPALWPCSAAI